jgi:hypothetical protein
MGGKSGSQTIGYHYLFSVLFGIGRGPLNELRTIMVADRIAWEGPLCDGDVQAIKKPDLFGGQEKEGGIQGPFRLFFGRFDQVLPGAGSANCGGSGPMKGVQTLPDVKATISAESPGLISEFRGVTMLWYDGLISSMNPYPKQWSFRVRRYSAGWYNDECWYPTKSVIFLAAGKVHAMNPAHIIYQCLTDPTWGRGLPASLIDQNSFIYAANKLCEEGFGLCLPWLRKEEVDQFVAIVQDYIDAFLYPDPETGKMTIRLLRNDYDQAALPLFTPSSGLIDILEDDSASQDDIFNEMIGQGFDPITKTQFTVRVHNLAARHSQGAPNPEPRDLSGIATRDLMGRVLQRDLKKMCSGLKRYIVVLDRAGWKIRPGMPFKVQDTRRGIQQVVLRAVEVTDQSFKDGRVTIKCTEDVFGLPATTYITTGDTSWTAPPLEAIPPADQALYEANYRDLTIRVGAANAQSLAPTTALFGAVALSPNAVFREFELDSRAVGEPDYTRTSGAFTGAATLVDAITILQTVFEITGEFDLPEALIGQAIVIDNEQMAVTAYDSGTHMMTVKRGCADTVPVPHAAAATLWTIDDDFASDGRNYASGEDVEALVLTRTSSDLLDPADATLMTLTLAGRHARPYPPAKVTVDTLEALTLPQIEHPEPEIDWVHRDRLLQEDQLVGYVEAAVGPEAGTTYNIRVYNADPLTAGDPPLRTVTALASGPWTYDAAMQAADGAPNAVYIELESERDGLASYQLQRFRIQLVSGYGVGYGLNYGGV